jgi:hypothetical protein
MKSILKVLLLPVLVCLASGVFCSTASAQSVTINLSEYDVIFLTDFFDVKSDKLSSSAPGFSVKIDGLPNVEIYLSVKVNAQLRGGNGDAGNAPLVEGCTNNIPPSAITGGSLVLTARDFAKGGIASLVPNRYGCNYSENTLLKNKIRDLALVTSTAPPGKYNVVINVFRASDNTLLRGSSSVGTINIAYSTPKEALVEIIEPKTGSYFNNLTPIFSWTTVAPNVIVRVYEAGLNHRSPQDALTGSNLCLEEHVNGATTLTYPATAKRRLQENRAYVVQVEASISTSRGDQGNLSQPVVFRITNDYLGKILDNFMNSVPGNASAVYSTLRAEPSNWIPWPPYGSITLNGTMLSESDLQVLLNELSTRQDVKFELSVENQ